MPTMNESSLILTTVECQTLSRNEAREELGETNRRIHCRIERLLTIAGCRGCPTLRGEVTRFVGMKQDHATGDGGVYAYLDDVFLRTLAIRGEQHLSPRHQVLEGLFLRRAELMAAIA